MAVLDGVARDPDTGVTMLDVVTGARRDRVRDEAERLLAMLHARVAGDYLQTAAIFDEHMNVLSLVTDPNDYAGPGTGYEPRRAPRTRSTPSVSSGRVDDLRAEQARAHRAAPVVAEPGRARSATPATSSSASPPARAAASGARCPG